MTDNEKAAYGTLATVIARQTIFAKDVKQEPIVIERKGQTISVTPPFFDTVSQSDLEWYAQILTKLGLIWPPIGDQPDSIFITDFTERNVSRQAMLKTNNGPSFDEMLAAFLYHSSEYGGGFRCYQTKSFPVCADFDPLFKLFVKIGYCKHSGREYEWTDKVSNAMQRAGLLEIGDDPVKHQQQTGRT